jgi:hypothetical protein
MATPIGDSFWGINQLSQPPAITINRDMHGLVFFTRPRLNLTNDNMSNVRIFTPLMSTNQDSIQCALRSYLDPTLALSSSNAIASSVVDPHQAFIPILSNHILSANGWPDLDAGTFVAHEGVYKETWSFIDSIVRNYSTYDITANFRNIPGDPITMLIFYWLHYAENVYLGDMSPYTDALLQNEIDYTTRIYRLVLDATKTKVQKIGATGAAFPISCPVGASFNFESSHPVNASNDQIPITFRCIGAMYHDDMLVHEFNLTVQAFNAGMKDANRTNLYTQIPMAYLSLFRNRGYPRINPDNYNLEWWVSTSAYNTVVASLNSSTIASSENY